MLHEDGVSYDINSGQNEPNTILSSFMKNQCMESFCFLHELVEI